MNRWTLGLAALLMVLVSVGMAKAAVLIAGAHYPDALADVQSKVAGTGLVSGDVDTFDLRSATPTLAELQAYDAVLVFTAWPVVDETILGNRLADYVDGGGGVVQAAFSFWPLPSRYGIGGRWNDDGYAVFQLAGPSDPTSLTLGTVHEPGHPILAGVSSFEGGSSSYHNKVPGVTAGATLIADWSNGVPLIAENTSGFSGRVIGLNFYPLSSDCRSDFWDTATDGALLMANALNYASPSAVIPEPSSLLVWSLLGALGIIGWWRKRKSR